MNTSGTPMGSGSICLGCGVGNRHTPGSVDQIRIPTSLTRLELLSRTAVRCLEASGG